MSASEVVAEIIRDLRDRKGLDDAWDQIDRDIIKSEIVPTWIELVKQYTSEPKS